MTAVGAGLWLSALDVRYRDVGFAIPFVLQVWLFASPIAYSSSLVSSLGWIYALNPVVAIAEGFRWGFLGTPAPSATVVSEGFAIAICLFIGGAYYFRRVERTFADVV
jgi:lipopolysaccharide transport system permease protein